MAHRWVMSSAMGVVLDRSEFVLHQCDNPPCVNPEHLFIGDHVTNMIDMKTKDRSCHGELRSDRLTEADVVRIREAAYAGVKSRDLAAEYSMSEANICMIIRGERWQRAGGPITYRYQTRKKKESING